jgi:hypothetical protein
MIGQNLPNNYGVYITFLHQLLLLREDMDGTYPQTGICLLVRDSSLVTFSSLLFDNMLHLPFCMLDDSSLDRDVGRGDYRGPTESILTRANLMYLGERQNISNANIVKTRHRQKILWRKEILSASNRSYHILVGL